MKPSLKCQKGQSVVEYLLLLAVISTISFSIFRGLGFKDLVGKDSVVFAKLRGIMEYQYRHAGSIKQADSGYGPSETHDSYWSGEGETHFFTPQDAYPANP